MREANRTSIRREFTSRRTTIQPLLHASAPPTHVMDFTWGRVNCAADAPKEVPVITRRRFVTGAPLALLGAADACRAREPEGGPGSTAPDLSTPGAPPTFGTMTQAGPEVSASTFAEAEKLVQVSMTDRGPLDPGPR
jgi:hypothetical protein